MKLLVPVNSLEMAEMEIKNGADEIYAGLTADWSEAISFSARGNFKRDGQSMVFGFDQLKELSALCHHNQVGLDITLNNVHITGFLDKSLNEQYHFLKYVEKVLEYRVNSLIISDIAAIKLVRKTFPAVHITSSSELEINNVAAVNFLAEQGANRIVLTYQITLDEIRHICENTAVEIEVFGHRGCSFHPGYCVFKHVVGEHGDNGLNVGTPCRNYYSCNHFDPAQKEQYLDASLMCSICSIPELVSINPSVLKLAGREMQAISSSEITRCYRKAIDTAKSGNPQPIIQEELPVWWKKTLCRQKRCKYMDNPTTQSFTGSHNFPIVDTQSPELKPIGYDQERPVAGGRLDEIRILNTAVFEKAVDQETRYIGIGHEYCSTLLRNRKVVQTYLQKIIARGKHPVLITPTVRARELELVTDEVLAALDTVGDLDIVFNDWGLLQRIAAHGNKTKYSQWWIGRLLSRSMADWPWFEMAVRGETEPVRQAFLCNYLNHDEMFPLLRSYRIDGVEVNNNALQQENCANLKRNGFQIKVHLDRKLLAVGRSCIYLSDKMGPNRVSGCDGNCGLLELKLTGLDSSDDIYLNNPHITTYYPDLLLSGTGIFEAETKTTLEIPDKLADRVCMILFN